MRAAEIRAHWKDAEMHDDHSVEVYKTFYLAELAAQLAEINDKLTPARILTAIAEIQGELDKRDKAGKP
jgi:hypothetical protein